MDRDRQQDCEEKKQSVAVVSAVEMFRSAAQPSVVDRAGDKGEERLSVFWRVFGGTLLSIVALCCVTVYNQVSGTLSDLRRDLNQINECRPDLVKKDDLNARMTSLWGGLKELQAANTSVLALSERWKLLDQQMERHMKASEDERKELTRKLEEQRRTTEEERRELTRRIEDQRKAAEEERRELLGKLQNLGERLATVEGRQTAQSVTKGPANTN